MIGIFYLLLIVVNIGTLLYMISETRRCESNYLETIDRLTADVDMKNKTISRQLGYIDELTEKIKELTK